MDSRFRVLLVLGLAAVACGGDGGEQATSEGTDPSTSAGDPTTATTVGTTISTSGLDTESSGDPTTVTASTTVSTTEADSSSSMGGSTFDLGVQPDVGIAQGCTAVDFLFVIDDSLSMDTHQANLIANFPAFIDGIEETLGNVDSYQVGVVATDPFSGNPGACILIGALVTSTTGAGANSSQAECGPYADGYNFMTQNDDLDASFACAAQVGTSGSGSERPMDAVVAAVDGSLAGVGGCNEGFLRDSALLVVVVITDEYDGPGDPEPGNGEEPATSMGDPQSWFDAVVAAKGGIEENAVALAIVNYEGGECEPAGLGFDGMNIVAWAELFGVNGFVGGLCEKDYGPMFGEATGVIAQACENFVPAG